MCAARSLASSARVRARSVPAAGPKAGHRGAVAIPGISQHSLKSLGLRVGRLMIWGLIL